MPPKRKRPRRPSTTSHRRPSASQLRALEASLERHRAGDLVAAERGYRALLERFPGYADAAQLLGVLYHQRGDQAQALRHIDAAIATAPATPGYHNNRGEVLRTIGRLAEAAEAYAQATALDPGFTDAWSNMALARRAMGELEAAQAAASRAVELAPEALEPRMALAECLGATGDWTGAVEQAQVALRLAPRHPQVLFVLGLARQGAADLEAATAAFQQVLELEPRHVPARIALAGNHVAAGDPQAAVAYLRAAVAVDPGAGEAWLRLGELQCDLEQFDAARTALERAAALLPGGGERVRRPLAWSLSQCGEVEPALALLEAGADGDLDTLQMRARINALVGRVGEAGRHYQAVVDADPTRAGAWHGLGETLIATGDFAQAARCLRRAVSLDPANGAAFEALAGVAPPDAWSAAELASLEAGCKDLSLDVEERASMIFAAARLRDRRGHYEQALALYQDANALMAERCPFDRDAFEALVGDIQAVFGAASGAPVPNADGRARRPPAASPQPVFIVGMPRSGTSLVEQILASHSMVFGAGEVEFFSHLRFPDGARFPAACAGLAAADLDGLRRQYLARLTSLGASAPLATDKMPGNFLYLGLIDRLFPDAHIVHCRRDSMDTCLSIYTQNFAATRAHAYAFEEGAIASYYKGYRTLMQHWQHCLEGRIHTLDYEAVVADPEASIRPLLAFLGLDWEPACLAFHRTERAVLTASQVQVRQPLYRSSVARWKRYGAGTQRLRDALGAAGVLDASV